MTLADRKDLGSRLVDPVVDVADRAGLTPNQVSLVAFLLAIVAAAVFAVGPTAATPVAALLVVVSGGLDVADGELARRRGGGTDRGDFLDHVLDRYSDLVLLVGVAAGTGAWLLGTVALTGVFLTSYMGTQAQAVGAGRDYGGLLGRADRIGLLVLGGLLQPLDATVHFGVGIGVTPLVAVLGIYAVLGNLTAMQRFRATWRELG